MRGEYKEMITRHDNHESAKIMTLLKNPRLFWLINDEFDKKIVNEKEARQTIFLNACGRHVENHNTTSYNLCVNSVSGVGKDWVTKNVLAIFPSGSVHIRTRISPTAFTYWHNKKSEPEWTWDGLICYLQDVSNIVLNCDVFKVMVSDGSCSTVVINQTAVDIIIDGKPVMFITTASADPKSEMLRRFPMLSLDETEKQTENIMKRQAEYAESGKNTEYNPLILKALASLKRVKIKVPFASDLNSSYPHDHPIMRTHFARLLDMIKASAALYQFQRKRDRDGYVIATSQDYEIAVIALKATTSNVLMIPLTQKQKKILSIIKDSFSNGFFSVPELSPKVPFLNERNLYAAMDTLAENFLKTDYQQEEKKRPVRVYALKALTNFDIPTWDEICRKKTIATERTKGTETTEGTKGNSSH